MATSAESPTVGQNAWRAMIGFALGAITLLITAVVVGLLSGLAWWLFQLGWGVFS